MGRADVSILRKPTFEQTAASVTFGLESAVRRVINEDLLWAVRVRQFVANLADAALHPRSASIIRFGQVCFGAHSRSALTKALASSMSFRIAAINRVSASRLWDIAAAQSVMVSYYFEELQDGSSDITMVPKDLDERILNRDTVDFISAVYKLPLVQRQRIVELVHALALDGHS